MTAPSATTGPRQLPGLTPENRAFWTGGAEGRLNIARCVACRAWSHPPLPVCPACRSRSVAPEAVSGAGVVATYTVNHQPWLPDMAVPFVYAAVELAEQRGLLVLTNIVNCPPERVRIGMAVRVVFEHHADVWIPLFEPAP